VAPVDKDRELHGARPPEVVHRVQAARTVRPENRTSSTSTTSRPSIPPPASRCDRAHAPDASAGRPGTMVTSRDPQGTGRPRPSPSVRQPLGERHPPGRDAEQHDIAAAFGAFEDLVGYAGERPLDVGGLQYGFVTPGGGVLALAPESDRMIEPAPVGPVRDRAWPAFTANLLSRLTGRSLKDVGPRNRSSEDGPPHPSTGCSSRWGPHLRPMYPRRKRAA